MSADRRAEIETNLATVRAPHRRRRAPRPVATRDEVTLVVVTKFFPASDVRLLAELGRPPRRREPPPGGGREGRRVRRPRPVLALHRGAAEQQGGRRRGVRRRGALARPGQAGQRPRAGAPWSVAATSTCSSRSASTRRTPPDDRVRRSSRCRPWSTGSWRPTACVLRGVMGVAPLDGDPGQAFARLAETAAAVRACSTLGHLGLGGHERRPRAGRRTRRDTPADWLGGPRSEATGQVGSEVPQKADASGEKAPREQRKTTDERDAEDGRLPRPARGR